MLTTKEVRGVKVVRPCKPGKEYTKDGLPRHRRKIGKIFKTVFSPDGGKVVGFIVRRPDLLWMFKRPERFLALDAMEIRDGLIEASKGSDSWDDRAIKRLDVDYDTCLIWEGMECRTSNGKDLGRVDEISFDEVTGDLNSFFLDDGGTARALIGSVEIPVELMVGYKKGVLIVDPEASSLLPTGGLAAKAGEATARAGIEAREGVAKAGKAASEAVDKGSRGLGRAIGRAKRSVTDAVDGFKAESGTPQKPAEKPASSGSSKAGSSKSGGSKASSAKGGSSSGSKASSGTAKKSSSSQSSGSSKSSSKKSVGEAVGTHMKGVGSMFSDFKKEFDDARKQ